MADGSAHGSSRATCRLTMARAETSPPPHTAEESTSNGWEAVSTTASSPIHTARPSIIGPASESGPQAGEEVGPQRREAAHLGIRLVEDVLGPRHQLEALQPAELIENPIGAAGVDPRVPAVVHVAEAVELAAHHVHLGEEGEAAQRLPGEAGRAGIARDARERPPGRQIVGVCVRVREGRHEIREDVDLRARLHALRASLPRVDGPAERRGGEHHAARDGVGEVGGEVRELEADAVLPEVLVEARVPGLAPLRLQVRIAELGEEEIVEGGRPESGAGAPPQPRARLLDDEEERPLPRGGVSEDAIVLDARAARDEEPVEEAKLLLEEEPFHVLGGLEDALVVPVLVAVAEPDRARAPRPDDDGVEELIFQAVGVHLGAKRCVEVDAGIDRILKALVVRVAAEAAAALPPFHRTRLGVDAQYRGLGLLLGVGVDDGHDGLGRREDALDGHAGVVLVVAVADAQRAVVGQGDADPAARGIVVRVVVLELPVALEVRAVERVVDDLVGAVDRSPVLEGVVVAARVLHDGGEGPRPLLGDDIDHPADGVRSVEGGLAAADDLDTVDEIRGDVGQVRLAQGRARYADPVHEDQDLVRVGASDAEARGLAVAAQLRDVDAGDIPEGVVDGGVVIGLEVFPRDHAQGDPELLGGRGDRGRRNHDRLDLLRVRFRLLRRVRLRLLRFYRDRHGQHRRQQHSKYLSHHRSFSFERGLLGVAIRSPDSWIVAAARPSRDVSQWLPLRGYGRGSPLTVAGPCRLLTGFPKIATITPRAAVSPPLGPEDADGRSARGGVLVHQDPAAVHRFQHRLLQHVFRGAEPHRRASREEEQAVGDLGGQVEIVGDDENAQSLVPVETSQERHTLRLVAQVEMRGGLVEHEESRLLGERPREDDALALASGEAFERLARESLDPGEGHGLSRDALVLPALEKARGSMREASHEDELLDGERKSLRDVLGHHGNPAGHGCASERRYALAADQDLPSRWTDHVGQESDHRGLSRRIGTDEPEHFAGGDGKAQLAELEGRTPRCAERIGEAHAPKLGERCHGATRATRERRSHMKKGAPQNEVSTPTESSAGATTVRARVSAARRKAPPPRSAAGTSTRLSGPKSIRNTWGTMRPTKPMGPTNATTVPVSSAAPTKMRRFTRRSEEHTSE